MQSVDNNAYQHGLELFNRGEFFEAHEVLEDVWRASPAAEKRFLQGLIQTAVGLHHYSRGNLAGARSVLARAHKNLSAYPERHGGVDLTSLRGVLKEWVSALERKETVPGLPRIGPRAQQG